MGRVCGIVILFALMMEKTVIFAPCCISWVRILAMSITLLLISGVNCGNLFDKINLQDEKVLKSVTNISFSIF